MRIVNKRAQHEYEILERFEAGVSLAGSEVKSIRNGSVSLESSFVRISPQSALLINAQVFPYKFSRLENYDPKRTRQLLLHKKQLFSLGQKVKSGNLTIIPVAFYTIGSRVKLEIALARGKKQYEKREKIKKRTETRDLERTFREKVKR